MKKGGGESWPEVMDSRNGLKTIKATKYRGITPVMNEKITE